MYMNTIDRTQQVHIAVRIAVTVGGMCACYVQNTGYISSHILHIVNSYVESISILVADIIPLLLCHQGEALHEMTYGMRTRRQNVYASLEVEYFGSVA